MNMMPRIAIVTDSTSDIPPDLAELHHIHIIPTYVIINGHSLIDGVDISRVEFYEKLPQMEPLPTTAAPSAGDFEQLYARLFAEGYEQILSIHCPAHLSAIFNAASLAAQPFADRISLVDSGSLSLGLGFQVLMAAEAASSHTMPELLDMLAELSPRVRVIALLDTLDYVQRSGRVSWARARIGNLLSLKPFIEVKEGKVLSLGEARTRQKSIARLVELVRNLGPLDRLAVLHSNAEDDARKLLEQVRPQTTVDPLVVNITTVIGIHVGPNGLGIAAVLKPQG